MNIKFRITLSTYRQNYLIESIIETKLYSFKILKSIEKQIKKLKNYHLLI